MEKRGFYFTNESWYFNENTLHEATAEIMFGIFAYQEDGSDGGCVAEIAMRWYDLQPNLGKPHTPKLEIFNDSWKEFSKMGDLIERLAIHDSKCITPKDFINILLELGFKDITNRESPYKEQEDEDARKKAEILAAMPEDHKRILGLK